MKNGFTLIEMLISVAIIAILTILIITYLNFSRNKSLDALMIENMGTPLTKLSVEHYLDSPRKNYADFCTDSATIDLLSKLNSSRRQCHSDANRWVVCAQLYSSSTRAWCADKAGVKKQIAATACDSNIKSCP